MAKVKTQYVCQNCGYISPRYLGKCPNCGAWNQFVEEPIESHATTSSRKTTSSNHHPELLKDVSIEEEPRVKTQMNELNRVLGGGIVPGSLVLIGGDPGIGKSTLLMQVSGQLQTTGGKVLYVSGEESATQIKLRANRLHVSGNNLYLFPETDMGRIRQAIDEVKPDYLVIDSIQTMNEPDLNSAIGSVSQVRTITGELMRIAKEKQVTTFIVGHVTKDGDSRALRYGGYGFIF